VPPTIRAEKPPYANRVTHRASWHDDPRWPGLVVELGLAFYKVEGGRALPGSDIPVTSAVALREVSVATTTPMSLRSVDVRAIPTSELIREVVGQTLSVDGLEEELALVARTHKEASDRGEDPLGAVAETLKLGRTAASGRIREARASGLLAPRSRSKTGRSKVAPRVAIPSESGRSPSKRTGADRRTSPGQA
jgi:hypothetical protein